MLGEAEAAGCWRGAAAGYLAGRESNNVEPPLRSPEGLWLSWRREGAQKIQAEGGKSRENPLLLPSPAPDFGKNVEAEISIYIIFSLESHSVR